MNISKKLRNVKFNLKNKLKKKRDAILVIPYGFVAVFAAITLITAIINSIVLFTLDKGKFFPNRIIISIVTNVLSIILSKLYVDSIDTILYLYVDLQSDVLKVTIIGSIPFILYLIFFNKEAKRPPQGLAGGEVPILTNKQ